MRNVNVNRIISDKAWRRVVSLLLALSVFMCSGVFYGLSVRADEAEGAQTAPEVTEAPELETEPDITDTPDTSIEPDASVEPDVTETPNDTIAPDGSTAVHEHIWTDYWMSDEFAHWQVCLECDAFNVLEHVWSAGEFAVYPTEVSNGVITYFCVVCGALRTVEVRYGETYCGYKYEHIHTDACYGWVPAPQPSVDEFVWGRTCEYNVEHLHGVECYVPTANNGGAVIDGAVLAQGDVPDGSWENYNRLFIVHNGIYERIDSNSRYCDPKTPYEITSGDTLTVYAKFYYIPPELEAYQVISVGNNDYGQDKCLVPSAAEFTELKDGQKAITRVFTASYTSDTPCEIYIVKDNFNIDGDVISLYVKVVGRDAEADANVLQVEIDGNFRNVTEADYNDNNAYQIKMGETISFRARIADGVDYSSQTSIGKATNNNNANSLEIISGPIKESDGYTYWTVKGVETGVGRFDLLIPSLQNGYSGWQWMCIEVTAASYEVDRIYRLVNGSYIDVTNQEIEIRVGEEFTVGALTNNRTLTVLTEDFGWNQNKIDGVSQTNGDFTTRTFRGAQLGKCYVVVVDSDNNVKAQLGVTVTSDTFESNKIYVDKEGNGNYVYHNTTPDNPLTLEVGQTLAIMSNPKAGGDYTNNVDPTGPSDPYIFIPASYDSVPDGFPSDYTENDNTYRFFYAAHAGETFFKIGGDGDTIYVKVNYVPQKIYVDKQDGTGYRIVEDNSEANPIILKVGETLKVLSRGASVASSNNGILSGVSPFAVSDETTYTFTASSVGTTTLTTGNDTLYVQVIDYEYNKIYYAIGNSEEYILAAPNQDITITENDTIKLKIYLSQPSNEYGSSSSLKYFYRPNGNDSVLNNFGTTFSDGNRTAETTITAVGVGDSKVSYEIPPGRINVSVNIHVKKGYASGAMFVDVVFGNSSYPDVEINEATSMIRGGINMTKKDHQGANKYMGDLENAAGNSPSNRFIMYVGETTTVRVHAPWDSENHFFTQENNGNTNSGTYITLGNGTSADENGYASCSVTALRPGTVEIKSDYSNEVFYIEVLYPIYVETSLGEKHMNYINEYVYTANDWWPDQAINIDHNVRNASDHIIFSPEGLPVFIKNYPGYVFGFYRLLEDQYVDLTTYTEVGSNQQFAVKSGPVRIEDKLFDGIVEKDGKQYRKVTVRVRAGWVNADTNAEVTFGDQIFDLRVYNIESDKGEDTGNHFDIERSDGGKYIITVENPDGTYTKYTYDVFVTDINGCNVYNKDGDLIAELDAGEYYERGQPEDSSQFELTSAYETDGHGGLVSTGGKQRKWIKISDIGEVIFDLQLELKNPQVEVVDANGKTIPGGVPEIIDELMNLDYLASVSVDMGYREIIDAYNKCPNHIGLDFTLKKEIFATRQGVEVNKRLTGAELEERQFEFEVFRNNPYKPFWDGENWVYPSPTAWAYNDADGLLHFWTYDDVVDDYGGITQQVRNISMLSFTDPGLYHFYIREIIPTTPDGIIYDTRLIRIDVKVEELASGLLKVVGTPEYYYSIDEGNNWTLFTSSMIPGFTNSVPLPLPETGGSGTERYLIFGIVLLFTGFLLLFLDRRRRGSRSANSATGMQ